MEVCASLPHAVRGWQGGRTEVHASLPHAVRGWQGGSQRFFYDMLSETRYLLSVTACQKKALSHSCEQLKALKLPELAAI